MARMDAALPDEALAAVEMLARQIEQLDTSIDGLAKAIGKTNAKSPMSRLLMEVPAVGPLVRGGDETGHWSGARCDRGGVKSCQG